MCHWIDTPSHGYLHLSPTELKRIPEFARRPSYEEDCEYTIAVVALPEIVSQKSYGISPEKTGEHIQNARRVCRDWYPDIYAQLTGETVTPANSRKLAKRKFHEDHAGDYVVICALGDHSHKYKGFVLCEGAKGGDHRSPDHKNFLVENDEYIIGLFGYVIQPGDLELSNQPT